MYRTKTYLAGDWTGDRDLIEIIQKWNENDYWALHFTDAHELKQARDTSLYCSIKKSLSERLDASKTFILIVGDSTNSLTKGNCKYCSSYNSRTGICARYHHPDFRSYIQFECDKAIRDKLKIVVIYNSATVQRSKCPEIVRYTGTHINGYYYSNDGKAYWNYSAIKDAIMNK